MICSIRLILTKLLIVAFCSAAYSQNYKVDLKANWRILSPDTNISSETSVPGCVHTAFMDAGIIDDPFLGTNEKDAQWIPEYDWIFRCDTFIANKTILDREHVIMRFRELDTYAEVFLNNTLILSADNFFRTYEVEVKELLKDTNEIYIHFKSPLKKGRELAELTHYELPGEEMRAVTRKPQYHYGWDWGPRLTSIGIHSPIEIEAFDHIRITHIGFKTESLVKELAVVKWTLEVDVRTKGKYHIDSDIVGKGLLLKKDLEPGIQTVTFKIATTHPAYWRCNGQGDSYLYPYQTTVRLDEKVQDKVSGKMGIRQVELNADKDDDGQSFTIILNGKPVFAKGANYIPMDVFLSRVSPEDYRRLLEDVKASNMNMIRVWGGGLYERDEFYNICDELGIMVWQDFMFACAMYPGDKSFLKNVEKEAIEQVRRLSIHPCLVLWCGNNEVSEGWERWGWQDNLKFFVKRKVERHYKKLFKRLLPRAVEDNCDIPYWESSPKLGRGDPRYRFEGDAHDWWVWHDAAPFETLVERVPRFMSEFGFQSFPTSEVLSEMVVSESPNKSDVGILQHQKHSRGFSLIDEYMERWYGSIPEDLNNHAFLSQVLQAEGIGLGMKAHITSQPNNMGTLYWQLNDCWPSVSWSSMDYKGNWKPLNYKAQDIFDPHQVQALIKDDSLFVYHTTDKLPNNETLGDLYCLVLSNTGQILQRKALFQQPLKTNSQILLTESVSDILQDSDRNSSIIALKYESDLDESMAIILPCLPREFEYPISNVHLDDYKSEGKFEIQLYSDTFEQGVFIEASGKGTFSDNYLDLVPGVAKTIEFIPDDQDAEISFTYNSVNKVLGTK